MKGSESFADAVVESLGKSIAGRSTRRSFFGKLASVVFGALGIELLPVLPVDRRAFGAPATGWQYCGAYGYPCVDCDGGGDDFTCPVGCTEGSDFWIACCEDDFGQHWEVWYSDCYTDDPANLPDCSNSSKTTGMACEYDGEDYPPPEGKVAWIPEGTRYCCSLVDTETYIPCA